MSPNDIQAPSLVRRLAIRMETEDAKNKWLAEEREKERVKKEEEEWVKKEEERRKNDIEDNEQKQHKEAEKKKKEEEEWLQWEEEERKQKVEEEERKKDEEEEERTQKEEEKERICKEAEAGLQRSISREQIAAEREAAQKVNNMSHSSSRHGQDQQQTDEWTTTRPAKAGNLTNFGKTSKLSTMMFGPSGVFVGKMKESKQDLTVSRSASSNMFSMLQNAEVAEVATKPSWPPSQKPSIDLSQSGMASEQLQHRKMQLLQCLGLTMRHSTKPPQETGTHLLAPLHMDAQLSNITRWGEERALTLLSPACVDSLPLTFTPHSTPAFPFTPNTFCVFNVGELIFDGGKHGFNFGSVIDRVIIRAGSDDEEEGDTVPSMSEEEAKQKIGEDLKEFFMIRDLDEAEEQATKLNEGPSSH
ncbi:hypothetical protein NEOLEDRAFT_1184842 [Neolentinus lepideus HHB14362 ss-1]|uniref:Uncharacterized protein n=1 Tax=Neolentinus lepideus HHB14362 ss-1 TaxID=1314782 RepID=A0A165LTE7_9AGAM|nr:hypothetical protein NEOLEDRAFT_1184842 [Neolentinus lepideus HHB14362 ss-1]